MGLTDQRYALGSHFNRKVAVWRWSGPRRSVAVPGASDYPTLLPHSAKQTAPTRALSRIPILELKPAYAELSAEFDAAYRRVMGVGDLPARSRNLAAFEEEFARFSGTRFCVGGVERPRWPLQLALGRRGHRAWETRSSSRPMDTIAALARGDALRARTPVPSANPTRP